MARILVFQHLDVEHPASFREFWAEGGHSWVPVELDRGEPIPGFDDFDLLVVMGGAQDVWQTDRYPWLLAEMQAIRRWVLEMGRPYLGICLGHQLLAAALGGQVAAMQQPEVGLGTVTLTPAGLADPLFEGVSSDLPVFQWHGAHVSELPRGAEVLAANPACSVQAIRCGRHAYGVQFHPEVSRDTIEDWERVPEYKASLVAALGAERAEGLAGQLTPRLSAFRETARRLNDNLMAVLGHR